MGEIRSTLDIIMEKTRDLSLSPEEKRKLKRQEWLGKARGWVQKYQDDLIDVYEVKAALQKLGESEGADHLLREEIIAAIEPGGRNGKHWDLLENLWNSDLKGHKEMVRQVEEELDQARRERIRLALDRLAERRYFRHGGGPEPEPRPGMDRFPPAADRGMPTGTEPSPLRSPERKRSDGLLASLSDKIEPVRPPPP